MSAYSPRWRWRRRRVSKRSSGRWRRRTGETNDTATGIPHRSGDFGDLAVGQMEDGQANGAVVRLLDDRPATSDDERPGGRRGLHPMEARDAGQGVRSGRDRGLGECRSSVYPGGRDPGRCSGGYVLGSACIRASEDRWVSVPRWDGERGGGQTMSDKIKRFLLMRFIPQRTMIGLGLLLASVTGVLKAILGSAMCQDPGTTATVCHLAQQTLDAVAPWLVIIGVTDRKREG